MKLSPTMQKVLEILNDAPYYYMAEGKTLEYLYTHEGLKGYWGDHKHAHVVTGNRVVTQDHTNTLKALEKRGLIEIDVLGGSSFDAVRVVGAVYEPPLTKARKIVITAEGYKGNPVTFIDYAVEGVEMTKEMNHRNRSWKIISIEDVGEVDLTLWDF